MSDQTFLGRGIITPFRRDGKNDFANASGEELVKSCVGQTLGTRGASDVVQGELPWRTEYGSLISTLRHRKNSEVQRELVRVHSRTALRRWNPRVLLEDVDVTSPETEGTTMKGQVWFSVIDNNVSGNRVFESLETEFEV